MSLSFWLSGPQFHFAPALNKPGRRQSCRQPTRSRPILEHLEERTLLDASSGLIGGVNNLTFNGAPASSGNVLPVPTSGEHAASISGIDASGRGSQASSDALLAQDQPNAQFRLFGVNSQGEGSRYIQQTTANILRDAYGFGSGTQPNAPWMPNAYNLGLANHQFGYSSQADMGYSSVPPWSSPVAQSLPKDQDRPLDKNDQLHFLQKDEQGTETPEQLADQHSTRGEEQTRQHRLDKDVGDKSDELQALIEQQTSEKKPPIETIERADGTLPDSLWLSALAPAPMAALVAGLPGMSAEAEGGDAGAESGGAEAATE
jgi:hypothetical protein